MNENCVVLNLDLDVITNISNEQVLNNIVILAEDDQIAPSSLEPLDLTCNKQSRKDTSKEEIGECSSQLLTKNPLHDITNSEEQKSTTGSIQKFLFWPDDAMLHPKNKTSVLRKIKTPSVVSGTQWQQIKETKENAKRIKIEEATIKKELRVEKQVKMKIEKEKIRKKKENDKFLTQQKNIEKERQKLLKQQERMKKIEEKKEANH